MGSNIEKRLKALLEVPGNETCSECDRSDNRPTWASFFRCPVDNRRLGVLCCPKCHHLHQTVGEGEFTLKGLRDVNDFTEGDLDVLELTGNNLVNKCYEAGVTADEKEVRDYRSHGYEAYFFEKFVNLRFFSEDVYRDMISASLKSLVEKHSKELMKGGDEKKDEDPRSYDKKSSSRCKRGDDGECRRHGSSRSLNCKYANGGRSSSRGDSDSNLMERDRSKRRDDDRRSSRDYRSKSRDHDDRSSHHRSSRSSRDDDYRSSRSRDYDDRKSSRGSRSISDYDDRKSSRGRRSSDYDDDRSRREGRSSRHRSSSKYSDHCDDDRRSSHYRSKYDDDRSMRGRSNSGSPSRQDDRDRERSSCRKAYDDDDRYHSEERYHKDDRNARREGNGSDRSDSKSDRHSSREVRESKGDNPGSNWEIPELKEDRRDRGSGENWDHPDLKHDRRVDRHQEVPDLQPHHRHSSMVDLRANFTHGERASRDMETDRWDPDSKNRVSRSSSATQLPRRSNSKGSSVDLRNDEGGDPKRDRMREQRKNALKRANSPMRTTSFNSKGPPSRENSNKSLKRPTSRNGISSRGSSQSLSVDPDADDSNTNLDISERRTPRRNGSFHQRGMDARQPSRRDLGGGRRGVDRHSSLTGPKRMESVRSLHGRGVRPPLEEPVSSEPKRSDVRMETLEVVSQLGQPQGALDLPDSSEPKPTPPVVADHTSTLAALKASAPKPTPPVVADHKTALAALKANAPKPASLILPDQKAAVAALVAAAPTADDDALVLGVLSTLPKNDITARPPPPPKKEDPEEVTVEDVAGLLSGGLIRKLGGDPERNLKDFTNQKTPLRGPTESRPGPNPTLRSTGPGAPPNPVLSRGNIPPKKTGTAWDILKGRRADFIQLAREEAAERAAAGNPVPNPASRPIPSRRGPAGRGPMGNMQNNQGGPYPNPTSRLPPPQRGAVMGGPGGNMPSAGPPGWGGPPPTLASPPPQRGPPAQRGPPLQRGPPPQRGPQMRQGPPPANAPSPQRGPPQRGLGKQESFARRQSGRGPPNRGLARSESFAQRQNAQLGATRRADPLHLGLCSNPTATPLEPPPPPPSQQEQTALLAVRPSKRFNNPGSEPEQPAAPIAVRPSKRTQSNDGQQPAPQPQQPTGLAVRPSKRSQGGDQKKIACAPQDFPGVPNNALAQDFPGVALRQST